MHTTNIGIGINIEHSIYLIKLYLSIIKAQKIKYDSQRGVIKTEWTDSKALGSRLPLLFQEGYKGFAGTDI